MNLIILDLKAAVCQCLLIVPADEVCAMKRIVDHKGFLSSDPAHVCQLLERWKPSSFDVNEKKQERELQFWLESQLPEVPIVAQYGIAKGKADIVIEDSHLIEVKLAFDSASVVEFDRCVGQLERYKQKWVKKERGPVYLVVVGESDAEFRDMLQTWFTEANNPFFNQRFFLIEKHPNCQ